MPVRVAKNAALIKNCRCEKCGGKKKKKKATVATWSGSWIVPEQLLIKYSL